MDDSNEFIAGIERDNAEFRSLKRLWQELLPEEKVRAPNDYELRCWIKIHKARTIRHGIEMAGRKLRGVGFRAKHRDAGIRFAGSVMDALTYMS